MKRTLQLCMAFVACGFFACVAAATDKASDISLDIAAAYEIRSSNPQKLQELLHSLDARVQSASVEQKEDIQYLKAYSLAFKGEYERAIAMAEELAGASRSDLMRIQAGAFVANAYGLQRDYVDGLRQLEITLPKVKSNIPIDLKYQIWGVAALIYFQVGQNELAIKAAENILSESPEGRTLCLAQSARYEALANLERLPKDFDELERATSQCEAIGEHVTGNTLRVIKAEQLLKQGGVDAAISLLTTHLDEIEKTGFAFLNLRAKSLLAELYRRKGDMASAEAYAMEVVQQAVSSQRTKPIVDAYYILYQVAQERRDLEQALVFYRRYSDANMEYLNDVNAREMAYQLVKQEFMQKEQQLKELNSQNDVLKLRSEVEKKAAQNSRLIIVLLILLLGGVGLWAVRTRRVHQKLREMAEVDALTGVCNRHHFTNQAERSLAMCAGAGEEVALVMFDLDHFKAVNDQYGHAVGDWVLKHVATTSRTFCRRVDTLGRIGGEEFAFLLHGCDLQTATRLAEDCRARIALIDTSESGYKYTITASFGAASSKVSGYQLTRLLSHADKMLYRAKSLGRNRVCAYDGNTEFEMPAEPLPRTGTVTHISSAHPEAANRSHHSAV